MSSSPLLTANRPISTNQAAGFTYLYDIARTPAPVDTSYTIGWKCEDRRGRIEEGREPHLCLHTLTPCDEVALASGDPPKTGRTRPAATVT